MRSKKVSTKPNQDENGICEGNFSGHVSPGQAQAETQSKEEKIERTMVVQLGSDADRTISLPMDGGIDRTIAMPLNTETVKTTGASAEDRADRTIMLSAENKVCKIENTGRTAIQAREVDGGKGVTRKTRVTRLLSHFTGSIKRDVGEIIEHDDKKTQIHAISGFEKQELSNPETDLELRYERVRAVASGMRTDYSIGRDLSLERSAGIHSLRENSLLDGEERDLFIREAEISAQLDHPAILPVYGIYTDYRGGVHVAHKVMEGSNILDYIVRICAQYRVNGVQHFDERKSQRARIEIFLNICNGIEYAHSQNIMHCNLHPKNIYIGEYHEVYISSWGYARPIKNPAGKKYPLPPVRDKLYAAPETMNGDTSKIDERMDVYLLGMILFEMATLQKPFSNYPQDEAANKIRNGEVPSVEHRFRYPIDTELKLIIQKAIAAEPAKRYESVTKLAEDLRNYLENKEISLCKKSLSKRYSKFISEHQALFFGGIMLFYALLAGFILLNIYEQKRHVDEIYMKEKVMVDAQGPCISTAASLNLQLDKFRLMLSSLSRDISYLLENKDLQGKSEESKNQVAEGLAPSHSAFYGGNVDFTRLELIPGIDQEESGAAGQDETQKKMQERLNYLLPVLLQCEMSSPWNASNEKRTIKEQVSIFLTEGCPVYRFAIMLDGAGNYLYPYTESTDETVLALLLSEQKPGSINVESEKWFKPKEVTNHSLKNKLYASSMAMPIYGANQKETGTVVLQISSIHLSNILDHTANRKRGLTMQYLLEEDGSILYQKAVSEQVLQVPKTPEHLPETILQEMLRTESGAILRTIDGVRYLYCYRKLNNQWYYVEKIDLAIYMNPIQRKEEK